MRSHAVVVALAGLALPALATAAPVERRLHSSSLEASSFLWNDWNKYQENYHPNYIADDDPKTAWVEGATGSGAGEWVRIGTTPLEKTTKVRLKIRNGYQKSKGLFAANARAKSVAVKLLPSGATTTATLEDKDGWQELSVTQPSGPFKGVELAVKSVYEGSKYADLCISDVQVFATSETPDNPAFEKSKRKALMDWRAARIATAKTFAKKKADLPLHPAYQVTVEDAADVCESCELAGMIDAARATAAWKEWQEPLTVAAEVAKDLDALPRAQLAPKQKQALPQIDGMTATDLYALGEGWYAEDGLHLPFYDSVSVLQADQLRILDVKTTLAPSAFTAGGEKCKLGDVAWVKRTAAAEKTAPDVVRAVLIGRCQLLEGREGSYRTTATQLVVYDQDGHLALVVGSGQIDGFRWASEDGRAMITGGRSLLAQGKRIEVSEKQ